MIARLRGIVDSLGDDWAVIDVAGVGYQVFCSARTLARLGVGEAAAVHVETHVREDHIHLYGFLDAAEREWFRLLTTVQGVGSKVALALLSVAPPDQLMLAIAAQDKAALTRASGVGPKLAGRIVSELKDRAPRVAAALGGGGQAPVMSGGEAETGAVADAVSALVNLGYKRIEAHAAVVRAAQSMGDGAAVQSLIRAGLKELGPRELSR